MGIGKTGKESLRPIVIDGCNVARLHGRTQDKFSVHGIVLVIEYFRKRGHEEVYAFLPEDKRKEDYNLLTRLEKEGSVIFTPSRKAGDTRIRSYDDRYDIDGLSLCMFPIFLIFCFFKYMLIMNVFYNNYQQ